MNNFKKNITAVIPCYNNEVTIQRALESVLKQSSPVDEIIILDDNSNDQTLNIVNLFKDNYPQISIYQFKNNGGPSILRNKGIELAISKYVAFLDADDSWHIDKIKIFNEAPDSALWSSLFTYSDVSTINNQTEYIPFWKQLIRNHVSCSTAVINKEIVHERFDEDMRHCEDYDFFTRISCNHTILLEKSELSTIHRKLNSSGGLSGDIWMMRKGEMKMYLKLFYYKKLLLPLIPILLMYSLLKFITKQLVSRFI